MRDMASLQKVTLERRAALEVPREIQN